jgi:hypothetical protein
MRYTDPRRAKPGDLGRIGHHAVGDPGPIGAPADPLEVLNRATAELGE